MNTTIAIAGKGGTGKSTVTGLIIQALRQRKDGAILAVDADPNANLNELLGLEVDTSIGEMQSETLDTIRDLPAGVPLSRHLEYQLHQAIVEGEGVDLLVMGRGEGPGCYCAVNNILRGCLGALRGGYRYTILDNEAGMEHLSRRIAQGIDILLMVSDTNPVAVRAAARISTLADELELQIGRRYLVLNRLQSDVSERGLEEIKRSGLEVIARVPYDVEVAELNQAGDPLLTLSSGSVSQIAVHQMLTTLLPKEEGA